MSGEGEEIRLLVYDHRGMEGHEPDWSNPEQPLRLHAARAAMTGFPPVLSFEQTGLVSRNDLVAVHDPIYVDWMLSMEDEEEVVPMDSETAVGPGTVVAACLAAGAAAEAARRVMEGSVARRALVLSRPPGHHATADRAMGYCFFNNVAVAARASGAARVLVVDWDVHPGNGTEALLGGREGRLVVDLHEEGQWPGTSGEAPPNVVRVPIPTGSGHAELVAAMREHLLPAAESFQPDLVLVSAGFDAHEDDPIGGLRATDETYLEWARLVRGVAERYASGRVVVLLEGGYDVLALGRGLRQVVTALIEDHPRSEA